MEGWPVLREALLLGFPERLPSMLHICSLYHPWGGGSSMCCPQEHHLPWRLWEVIHLLLLFSPLPSFCMPFSSFMPVTSSFPPGLCSCWIPGPHSSVTVWKLWPSGLLYTPALDAFEGNISEHLASQFQQFVFKWLSTFSPSLPVSPHSSACPELLYLYSI